VKRLFVGMVSWDEEVITQEFVLAEGALGLVHEFGDLQLVEWSFIDSI